MFFYPQNNQPPSASYGTLDVRNGHLVIELDDSAAESCIFSGVLPRNYASGGITVRIAWMAATATTGDVVFGASFERHQDDTDDLDSDSFAAEQTATATTASATGEVQYTAITFTDGAQLDSLAVSEHFRLKVRRVATDGADTLVGDCQILSVELQET
jgi:hypothetical protein